MRKAELKKQAERIGEKIAIYKSLQYRWVDGQTADPQIQNVGYHLSESGAVKAADSIDLDLGFQAQVDRILIDYDDFNEGIDFGQEFDLEELDNHRQFFCDCETVYTGDTNTGKELDPDAIVIMYRHKTYMNYAYSIEAILFVSETNLITEADLRDDSDSLRTTYCTVVADLDELAEAFERGNYAPFNKINSGSRIVREFLEENGHPDYATEEEEAN